MARRNNITVNKDVILKNMSKNIIDINDYKKVIKKEIAYILGLIWADGCVSFANNKSKTPIVKHSCVFYDSEKILKIFEDLNWRNHESTNDKSIGKNKMVVNWVSSRLLGEYLIEENYRNKELGTFIYEKFNSLKSHFLRGLFDGDGCITISNSGIKYKQTAIYFSSSLYQDWTFLENILKEVNVDYSIREMNDKLGSSSQLCIHKSESIKNICEFMYDDSENIRLERKYLKYVEFLNYKETFR